MKAKNLLSGSPLLGLILLMAAASPCFGTIIDLTAGPASSGGTIYGAYFVWSPSQSTGTGILNSFVQIGKANQDVVEAYNTTVDGVLNNGHSDQFNHELTISDVPIVTDPTDYNGNTITGTYYEFLLDINQQRSAGLSYLSLDEIQVFTSDTANQSVSTFTDGEVDLDGTLHYRMDDFDVDSWIKLDFAQNPGSGAGDMFFYLPTSAISSPAGDYVYLYSKFGINNVNNDGFEEWATRLPTGEFETPIPEPSSLILLGTGLGALGLANRRRKKK